MDQAGAEAYRRRLLAGLTGRVLEVGAGNGRNFPHYPARVTEVVAVEPEPRLRAAASRAAAAAPVRVERIRQAWHAAGRDGEPRIAGLVHFGLGHHEASRASLRRYYGFLGDWVEGIVESAVQAPEAAGETVRAFADVGMTELLFMPTVGSVDEVDRLADAVL